MICGKGQKEVKTAFRREYSDIRGIFDTFQFQKFYFPAQFVNPYTLENSEL
jgi:hypothetical protein